jgi:hypothetical protein
MCNDKIIFINKEITGHVFRINDNIIWKVLEHQNNTKMSNGKTKVKGKGNVHPRTDHERPQGEQSYSSIL